VLDAIRFLKQLERHNDRAWFAEHKERYLSTVLLPVRKFVHDVSEMCERRGIPIYGDSRRSIFRIYRDIRFSPDKRPFKTHASAYLSRDGGRTTQGGLYLHVSPEESFLSIAFFQPPSPMLRRWRLDMAEHPERFTRVLRALRTKRLAIRPAEEWWDGLKRMPRGFEAFARSPLAPYFRLQSFAVRRTLTQREVASPRLAATAVRYVESAGALLRYGWQIEGDIE
jgi:uncharacterized protein (TIGR02453 family)